MPLFEIEDDKIVVPKKKSRKRKRKQKDNLTPIQELIKRRRLQMVLHSALYYHMNTNIISDDTWQQWADELADLQKKYPDDCNIDWHDQAFEDWTGATGMHLPFNANIQEHAEYILKIHERLT